MLLALMALQFRRYPQSQIFAFDFGGSIRAATIAMGGDWHDIGGVLLGESAEFVALQPLAAVDEPSERSWAAEWVAAILGHEKVEVTPCDPRCKGPSLVGSGFASVSISVMVCANRPFIWFWERVS